MKRSTIGAILALVMVFIYISTTGNKFRIYEKQVIYNTPEEAIHNFIGYINVEEKVKDKESYYSNKTPREFLESVSKRYRVFIRNGKEGRYIYYGIPVFADLKISELKDKKDIDYVKNYYENSIMEIDNYEKPKEIRYFQLYGEKYSYTNIGREDVNKDGTTSISFDSQKYQEASNYKEEVDDFRGFQINLVVVNEGEGYVVDYYDTFY